MTNDDSAAGMPPALKLPVVTTSLASIVDPIHKDDSATTLKQATPVQGQSHHSKAVTENNCRHSDIPPDTKDPRLGDSAFGGDWSMLENDPTLYDSAFAEEWNT